MKRRSERRRSSIWTRSVEAQGEPLDRDAEGFLQEAAQALEGAVRALKHNPRTDNKALLNNELEALIRAISGAPVPSPATAAARAIEALRLGAPIEDLPLAVSRPEAVLIDRSLHIEGIGVFRVSRSLGEGLVLLEASLRLSPFPPPSVLIGLTIGRETDLSRDGKLADL